MQCVLHKKYHVPWVSFVSTAKLPNSSFYDLWHLVEPGRTKWQAPAERQDGGTCSRRTDTMAAARKVLGRRPVLVAARLSLILLLAAGLAALTLIAAPAHAGDEGDGPVTALVGAAPASVSSYAPDLVAPVGEETRGNDYGRDWQHCVQVVANLRAEHPKVPLVVLLGGSSARECTVLDDDWERQIERRSDYVVDAYNLGSKHRTYAQDLAFVKLLPANVPTIVYIGVNLGRFCLPARSASITLPRPRPLTHYPQHVYSSTRIQSYSTKRYYVSYWLAARYPEFRANYSAELGMLQKIIRDLQAPAPARRAGRPAPGPAGHRLVVRRTGLALPRRLCEPRSRLAHPVAALQRRRALPRPRLLRHLPPRRAGPGQVPEHPLGQDDPAAEAVPHAQADADAVAVTVAVAEPVVLRVTVGVAVAVADA